MNPNLRLTSLSAALIAALLFSAWLRRVEAEAAAQMVHDRWTELSLIADSMRPTHQVIWGVGTSLFKRGLDTTIECQSESQQYVFLNLGKAQMWFDLFEKSGVLAGIQEAHPEDWIWAEARELWFANYGDWHAEGKLAERLHAWYLRPLGSAVRRIWSANKLRFLDAPFKANAQRTKPLQLDSTTYNASVKSYHKEMPMPWVQERRLMRLRQGEIDALLEIPTSLFTRAANHIPDSVFRQRGLPSSLQVHRPDPDLFHFADYRDVGHMNAKGREKMSRCICEFLGAERVDRKP